ncbi:MAG: transposase, partial [Nitrospinae bacterium]|nr:transposase [Nitrospinota bacterium]
IGGWIAYYNSERPHSSLGDKTPDEAYIGPKRRKLAA